MFGFRGWVGPNDGRVWKSHACFYVVKRSAFLMDRMNESSYLIAQSSIEIEGEKEKMSNLEKYSQQ